MELLRLATVAVGTLFNMVAPLFGFTSQKSRFLSNTVAGNGTLALYIPPTSVYITTIYYYNLSFLNLFYTIQFIS